ncbi:MAG: DUF4236 domain-containing protein [Saprospiraceae bacterium]
MGLFIRKSKKIGPFRLNLSKSGLGISTGITGARVSVGPNGTFVHLGRHGLYYRKKLNTSSKKKNTIEEVNLQEIFSIEEGETKIETKNFDGVTDIDSQDFIHSLENQDKKLFLYKWLGILPLLACAFYIYYSNANSNAVSNTTEEYFRITAEGANIRTEPSTKSDVILIGQNNEEFLIKSKSTKWFEIKVAKDIGFIHNSVGTVEIENNDQPIFLQNSSNSIPFYPLLGFIPIIIGLFIYDKKRKRIDIIYSMDEEFIELHNYQKDFFKEFQANRKIWQKKTSKRVTNSKYHGGAGSLIKRIAVKLTESDSLPTPLIRTNVEIPHISLSNIDLYFFPERLVLKQKGKFAAIFYKNMKINESSIKFIEDEKVPKDASIIDYTWKFVNKKGGPDKRFNGNRQIPICNYYEYNIVCNNGINEVLMTSKVGGMHKFCDFVNKIGDYQYKFERIGKSN